ncbi:hypothetical protein [Sphingomonas sp. TDK1]|uniref:hypothetical protein n=1 Tax=Sphingomonas sp. TDK1 TaxID=453247 RepID=UPI001E43247B|nr:hypothetical protein [Sphingomonas sp. TDK1]
MPVCTAERDGDGLLILRHPDGGFRRLRIDGNSLSAADGAEPAMVRRHGGEVELTIGGMRYRLNGKGATAGG